MAFYEKILLSYMDLLTSKYSQGKNSEDTHFRLMKKLTQWHGKMRGDFNMRFYTVINNDWDNKYYWNVENAEREVRRINEIASRSKEPRPNFKPAYVVEIDTVD